MNYDFFSSIANRISKRFWICLVSGLVMGWVTHAYMLMHKLPNWDDTNCLMRYGQGDNIGRWFLRIVHPYGTQYSIPAIHGMLAIVCISLAACFVVEALDINSMTGWILVPALMVSFPSVACTMTFMFTVHAYALAILMLCAAVFFLRKYKWGWVVSVILIILSLGIYQSYASVAIALILLGMIVDLLRGEKSTVVFRKGILYAIMLLVSVFLYIRLSHWIFPDLDSQTYGGVGNMGKISLIEMPINAGRCYKRFLEYFIWKPFDYVSHTMQVLNQLTCAVIVCLTALAIFVNKLYHKIFELLLLGVCLFFMPFAVAFVYFMAPEAPFSTLMIYAYVFIYILVIVLWENINFSDSKGPEKLWIAIGVLAVLVNVLSVYENYLVTNTAYMRMEISYDRVYAYLNRIISNVEATEGYTGNTPITILGEFHYQNNPSPVDIESGYPTEILRDMSGVALENGLLTSGVRDNFIRNFIGVDMAHLSEGDKQSIMNSEKYKEMPNYPEQGSIALFDGVWVVKLCD